MKFATYSDASGSHAAVLEGDQLYPVPGVDNLIDILGDGLEPLLEHGRKALEGEGVALDSVRLESPVTPWAVRDSMCFHEHIQNALGEIDPGHHKFPVFYVGNPMAIIGPSDVAHISPGCQMFDYELEVAAVVGKPGANIAPADAQQHIIGYTMYIDWSARDLQFEEMKLRLGPAKGKDGATTLGPVLVTADEFEAHRSGKGFDLAMSVAINGKPISKGNWSTINWSFNDVVAFTSRGTKLNAGDVLGSGTVGLGCLYEHFATNPDEFPGWLKPGDVVTFEVDLIGRMDLTVGEPEVLHPLSSGH